MSDDAATAHGSDAAPGALAYVEQLVNTYCEEYGVDDTPDPDALTDWLHARGLLPEAVRATADDHARTIRVREGLRALLVANNGPDTGDDAALAGLAALAGELPLVVDVAARPPRLVPQRTGGIDEVLAGMLAAVVDAVAAGTWHRMKACRNPQCRWAYHDQSRNRSRSWCSMETCGNRAKARAFRNRG